MATLLILLALTPILIFATWLFSSALTASTLAPPPTLRNQRIILLIAHPDDEAMFFAPTLQALTAPALGNHVKILCLSTGDADGLGQTRGKELIESALLLGVRKREDVFVMDDVRFKDGMQNEWKKEDVCRVLGMAFAPQIVSSGTSTPPTNAATATSTQLALSEKDREKEKKERRKSTKASKPNSTSTPPSASASTPEPPPGPRATIDVLITFDAHGISAHPNHIALHAGARAFLSAIMRGHAGWRCPVVLYTLPTVNLLRKYTFVLDALTTLADGVFSTMFAGAKKGAEEGEKVLFVNDVSKYWAARNAMVRGHQSQMVWFRWGWISLGRYMVVNDLKRERVAGG